MQVFIRIIIVLLFFASSAAAALPDAATIVQHMRAALEPTRPFVEKLTVSSRDARGEESQVVAYQAYKTIGDDHWRLIVLQAPENRKGISYLIHEQAGKPDFQWEYLPVIRRVREVGPLGASQKFLGTTFTYGDLELADLRDRNCQLLGLEKHAGVWAYKLEETPQKPWYYSRIITWIAMDSFLPLERKYYAPSHELWRLARFGEIKNIDGVPTPLWISIENRRDGSRSTIDVTAVHYDADLPATFFDPDRLAEATNSPVWLNTFATRKD